MKQGNESLRDFTSAQERLKFLEKKSGTDLSSIADPSVDRWVGHNIENAIGSTKTPLGSAELRIRHSVFLNHQGRLEGADKTYCIPLATSEGALVASVSRGCKAITKANGAIVFVEDVGITRGPVFKVKDLKEAFSTRVWIEENFPNLAQTAESTSSHLKLLMARSQVIGRNLFVRFSFDTQDAMGMNMATMAAEAMVKQIEQETNAKCVALSGNFCVDKKPSWLNFIEGRGKKVWAEAILPKEVVADVLKTTPRKIVELVEIKCHLGSIMSGSMGFNSQFANIAAASFESTGQDLAHVAEASLGVTTAEAVRGKLHFSVYLPDLIIGIVGGGTYLPTKQNALRITQVSTAQEFAAVVGGAVLAGELSQIASLAEGSFARAHQRLGRKGK